MIGSELDNINLKIQQSKNAAIKTFFDNHPKEAVKYVKELQQLDRQRAEIIKNSTPQYDTTKSDSD